MSPLPPNTNSNHVNSVLCNPEKFPYVLHNDNCKLLIFKVMFLAFCLIDLFFLYTLDGNLEN